MPKSISAFGEDFAHRQIIHALIMRIAKEVGIDVEVDWRSARHGHGRVVTELKEYLRDIRAQGMSPDLVVVATDANCKGLNQRAKELPIDSSPAPTILAIPDPHIERWLLLDGAAFKTVFGQGCQAPDQKCARDRYKHALIQAIAKSGISPSLGGIEFAAEIVEKMDLRRAADADASLGRFLDELRHALQGGMP